MMPHIEIKTKGIFTTVTVDGHELSGIRRLEFIVDAEKTSGRIPILRLDLLATDLTIDTHLIPELPEPFKCWYKPTKELR